MDCDEVIAGNLVERYLLGELAPEEEREFEEHYFGCQRCFEELLANERILSAIKTLAERGIFFEEAATPSFLTRIFRWRMSPVAAVALLLAIGVLIYPAWRGIVIVPHLSSEIERFHQPQANLLSYSLKHTTRSEMQRITLPKGQEQPIVLHFTVIRGAQPTSTYDVDIVNAEGSIIWSGSNIEPAGEYGVLSLLCYSSFFGEGRYRLRVFEVVPETGQRKGCAEFDFLIERR